MFPFGNFSPPQSRAHHLFPLTPQGLRVRGESTTFFYSPRIKFRLRKGSSSSIDNPHSFLAMQISAFFPFQWYAPPCLVCVLLGVWKLIVFPHPERVAPAAQITVSCVVLPTPPKFCDPSWFSPPHLISCSFTMSSDRFTWNLWYLLVAHTAKPQFPSSTSLDLPLTDDFRPKLIFIFCIIYWKALQPLDCSFFSRSGSFNLLSGHLTSSSP